MADKSTEAISLDKGGLVLEGDRRVGSWYMTAGMYAANLDDGSRVGPFEDHGDLTAAIEKKRDDQDGELIRRERAGGGFTGAADDTNGDDEDARSEAVMAADPNAADVRPAGSPVTAGDTPSTAEVEAAQAKAELEGDEQAQSGTPVSTDEDSKPESDSQKTSAKRASSSKKSSKSSSKKGS